MRVWVRIPGTHEKAAVYACKLALQVWGKRRQAAPWGPSGPAGVADTGISRFSERSYLKKMKWKKRKVLGIDLSPPRVHTGKYTVPTCVRKHIPNTETDTSTHTHMRETQCCCR